MKLALHVPGEANNNSPLPPSISFLVAILRNLISDVTFGSGDPIGAPISVTTVTPELPTIMMAGLACVFVLGNAGRNLLRRRKLSLGVAPNPS